MKLEVRCCCQPTKLLGWLPVPDGVKGGQIVQFVVSPARWHLARIDSAPSFEPVDCVALPVEAFVTYDFGEPVRRNAFKSEETPIERLRLIRGFVENHEQ